MAYNHKYYFAVRQELHKINIAALFQNVYYRLGIMNKITDKSRKMEVIDAKKIATRICIELMNEGKEYAREYGVSEIARVVELDHSSVSALNRSAKNLLSNDRKFIEKYNACLSIKIKYSGIKQATCNLSLYQFKRA